jgi:uncharacterized protein (TIGR02996 family)
MAKARVPTARPKPRAKARGPTRTPAMKSELKSRAKAGSSRAPKKPPKPSRLATLLDAIRATPADLDLHLVLADAFEEAGELARAELVRAQVAVARDAADTAATARAAALQADRDKLLGGRVTRSSSRRGLVWHVEASTEQLLANGAALFEADPITSVTISDARDEIYDDDFDYGDLVAQLAQQPWLAHIHALDIPAYTALCEPSEAVELLGSPHLLRLTQLKLGGPDVAIAAAKRCPLPQLRSLLIHCEASSEGDDTIKAFAHRPLTHLELVGCGTSADGMRALAAANWPLVRLVTAGTHYTEDDIGEPGMRALANAASLTSLLDLDIETANLDDAAMRALASSPHLRSLETLSLFGNAAITDDGLVMLADSPVLATVRRLDLTGTSVTARGVATLPDHVDAIAPHLRDQ